MFLLKINSNQQFKKDDQNFEDDFKIIVNSINQLLHNIDKYVKIPDTKKWNY